MTEGYEALRAQATGAALAPTIARGLALFLSSGLAAWMTPRISKQVELSVGDPAMSGDWLVIPVAWHATGPGQLFPTLEGKLTVQPLGPHSCTLWLGGTYQPPLGALGREIDKAVLHNMAEATIQDFVEGVAARLSELAANRPA